MKNEATEAAKRPFYITTTLPYVNADPHIGFAMELIRADVLARYKSLQGYEVFFNTGTDEHGQKLYQKATEAGVSPQEYVDKYAEKFRGLQSALGLWDQLHFIRTTDKHHVHAAQLFWQECFDNGFIYKKKFKGLYCVGCEMFVTEKDLVNGECPDHPGRIPEETEEENYFFKFSEFQNSLLDLYAGNPEFVRPDFRFNEIKSFVSSGLQDFSISRLKERMPWGVPVPGDEAHVMYVWFDALVNYISTLGWHGEGDCREPEHKERFKHFWCKGETVQIAGKDNLRQQAAMWQAMLMAADLPTTEHILINGFITSGGQKMSKSIGNVINPYDLVDEYGTDALRYYVVRELSQTEDSDVTLEKFKEVYNGNLANGIGNLVNRILKMSETHLGGEEMVFETKIETHFAMFMDQFEYQKAAEFVWHQIGELDQKIADTKPFSLVKKDAEAAKIIIRELVQGLHQIAIMLQPILPETSEKILAAIAENKKPIEPLFVRKD